MLPDKRASRGIERVDTALTGCAIDSNLTTTDIKVCAIPDGGGDATIVALWTTSCVRRDCRLPDGTSTNISAIKGVKDAVFIGHANHQCGASGEKCGY